MPRKKEVLLAIDTETNGLSIATGDRPFIVSACRSDDKTWVWEALVNRYTRQPTWTPTTLKEIRKIVASADRFIFHNASFDLKVLESIGINLYPEIENGTLEDTMFASHVCDSGSPTRHGLKALADKYLGIDNEDEKLLRDCVVRCRDIAREQGWNISEDVGADYWLPRAVRLKFGYEHITAKEAAYPIEYARLDVIRTLALWVGVFEPWLKRKEYLDAEGRSLEYHYRKNLRCLLPIKEMEATGLAVRTATLHKEIHRYNSNVEDATSIIRTLAGDKEFNPGSVAQCVKLFHGVWDHPIRYRTDPSSKHPNGQPQLDVNALQAYRAEIHKQLESGKAESRKDGGNLLKTKDLFLTQLLTLRKSATANSYLNSYLACLHNGRLYGSLNPCGTITLRLSGSNPNPQNIGKGKEIELDDGTKSLDFVLRCVFGPAAGYRWYDFDYDQLQLRIFAYATREQKMIDAFLRGDDFHSYVACEIFQTAPDQITKLQRRIAKNVNFGYIFGAGPTKIDATSGIKGLSVKLKKLFPSVAATMQETIAFVRKHGFVRTLGGYPITVQRSRAYAGVCSIIQGTEGEIVKEAMYRCYKYLEANNHPLKMVLQVHDELIFESTSPQKELLGHLRNIKSLMEQAGSTVGVVTPANGEVIVKSWDKGKELSTNDQEPIPEAVEHFKKITIKHPSLKTYLDEHDITLPMLTCARCKGCSECDLAFDPYNTDGDCLMDK